MGTLRSGFAKKFYDGAELWGGSTGAHFSISEMATLVCEQITPNSSESELLAKNTFLMVKTMELGKTPAQANCHKLSLL